MPLLKKPCAWPGCPAVVKAGEKYCSQHKTKHYQQQNERRGTAAQRGYDTRWKKVREMYLRQHPLCELCEQEDRTTLATMVHHKRPISRGGPILDMNNLMSVCRACHDKLHSKG